MILRENVIIPEVEQGFTRLSYRIHFECRGKVEGEPLSVDRCTMTSRFVHLKMKLVALLESCIHDVAYYFRILYTQMNSVKFTATPAEAAL
jgi:phosphatidylinositol kinase/protein kinase (PI-3  family)